DRTLFLLPASWQRGLGGIHIPGLGIVLVLGVVLLTGVIAANFVGQRVVALGELLVARIPLVRSIYSGVKQLLETVVASRGDSFRKVALVEYPRAGAWTVAFVTGEGEAESRLKTGQDLVHIYVPTTPNPTSGFFLMVPRHDLIELDMSVDEGLKMILSVGAVVPHRKKEIPAGAVPGGAPS
ncbi:MAG TPA: DUF502 domain-containing protein, partial [Acidiferrobacteraceae bacterium]|nr:DUF502 domain-containing protein [Acidiferrobacteraceae bacterium]